MSCRLAWNEGVDRGRDEGVGVECECAYSPRQGQAEAAHPFMTWHNDGEKREPQSWSFCFLMRDRLPATLVGKA